MILKGGDALATFLPKDGGDITLNGGALGSGGNDGDIILASIRGLVGIGTTAPTYPLTVIGNVSGISIWSDGNISADDYITRTSVFDTSKNTLDYIKDASYYMNNGEIDHTKFYGYTFWIVPDKSKPVEVGEGDELTITYPNNLTIEGVSLNKEIDVLRQAVYEMANELCLMGREDFC